MSEHGVDVPECRVRSAKLRHDQRKEGADAPRQRRPAREGRARAERGREDLAEIVDVTFQDAESCHAPDAPVGIDGLRVISEMLERLEVADADVAVEPGVTGVGGGLLEQQRHVGVDRPAREPG